MIKCGDCFISSITLITFFVIFVLCVSHGGFKCEINTTDGTEDCPSTELTETSQEICDGTVFKTTIVEDGLGLEIICPWAKGTLAFTLIGVFSAITFTILAVLHRTEKVSLKPSIKKKIGILCIGILTVTMVLMIIDIGTGGRKCKEFHEDMKDASSDAHCTNMVFGMTLLMVFAATLAFGYQVYQQQENSEIKSYNLDQLYVKQDKQTKYYSFHNN